MRPKRRAIRRRTCSTGCCADANSGVSHLSFRALCASVPLSFPKMRSVFLLATALCVLAASALATLPFSTVFQGRSKFDQLVAQAPAWKSLPIGERVGAVGRALVGTPY